VVEAVSEMGAGAKSISRFLSNLIPRRRGGRVARRKRRKRGSRRKRRKRSRRKRSRRKRR